MSDDQFRLQFAGHETFPLRYGWLKKSYDSIKRANARGVEDARAVFADDAAISAFGVGKNMVTSMRHWMQAVGILKIEADSNGALSVTEVGDLLLGDEGDPYLELPSSLWLLHWNIVSNPARATTWYWVFNECNEASFTRDTLRLRLARRCAELAEESGGKVGRVSDSTLKGDVLCFIRTYAQKAANGRQSQEDSLECPLTELGLVQSVDVGNAFQLRRGPKPSLPDEVFLYALIQFWQQLYPTRREFTVEAITHEPGSPGRAFVLDEDSVAERLERLAPLTGGAVRWDESTGMRQVYCPSIGDLEPIDFIIPLYASKEMAA
ncbi:DUF4007 family protein [Jiella sp. M17.18]|uniref:DUF4007 family protein n=1 Tax=Jiella sp. M17.18 TaxID=3234247 RepID=UPI0034DE4D4C